MKRTYLTIMSLAFAMAIRTANAQATVTEQVQVPIPATPAEVPGPFPGNIMTKDYVQMIGRMAYVWGYPMVNAHNRRVAFSEAPEPMLLGGILPFAPVGRRKAGTQSCVFTARSNRSLPRSGVRLRSSW
ncbi:MAG: hypothetical protein WA269_02275 [Candidatus Udaeobacter sp.]